MAENFVLTNAGRQIVAGRMAGTANEPKYLGIGTGATSRTAAVTDTALSTPLPGRATGTTSAVANVYKVEATYTLLSDAAVNEMGLFDAATAGSMFLSETTGTINLKAGDQFQVTYNYTA